MKIQVVYSRYSGRVFLLLIFLPVILAAQRVQDGLIPLKNWSTPLYWHANQAEKDALGNAVPQLQFSSTAVSGNALSFVAITPCRLVDTRGAAQGFVGLDPFAGPSLKAGQTVTFPVQSSTETSTTGPAPCGQIPSIAAAYSLNLTVVPHAGGEVVYVQIWPAGAAQPYVSNLNDSQGVVVSNAAIIGAGTPDGGVSVFNYGPATIDVIIDLNGFFTAPTDENENTAVGAGTLANDTSGFINTSIGYDALTTNTSGYANTATGVFALRLNTIGINNTATGNTALGSNTSGSENTASGLGALGRNSTGSFNTATGGNALVNNTIGNNNTASGSSALAFNQTGGNNTAIGYEALAESMTGSGNVAIGFEAALNAPAGNSNSIYIGSQGTNTDNSGTIQIGTQGTQTGGTFIAGISGASASSGVEVLINSSGQLGTVLSSGRFKEQITDMGDNSSKLLQLRPVNFFYKPDYDDGSHMPQYGLIAEEVAKIYPEMVAYGNDGQILTVKYQLLAPMLLNEVQKQATKIRSLEDRLAALETLFSNVSATAITGQ